MTEQEFIRSEQHKCDITMRHALRMVLATGYPPKAMLETLLCNDLARFGPPNESSRYNCYRLTPLGREELRRLSE